MGSHRHVILHLPAKFGSNRTNSGEVECTHLRRWKSICLPNSDEISQSTAEIKLLPVLKTDGCHVGILLPVFMSTHV